MTVLAVRHDAHAALLGGDDAGAIGPDEAGARLCAEDLMDAQHVVDGDVLGNGDHEGHFRLNGLDDGGGGMLGGDENGGDVWLHRLYGLANRQFILSHIKGCILAYLSDRVEYREIEVRLSALAGGYTAYDLGPIRDCMLRVCRGLVDCKLHSYSR